MMDFELDYKIRTKKYDPTYKIKTYNEAMEFLEKAEYINSSHFNSMYKDEQMPNLSMPWHLKLEHWIDINHREYNHFLIIESKPMRKYPEVDQEDDGCLPGDHEEKSEDFWGFLPGKRIYVPWFMYSNDPNYIQRCSYEFVGYKTFDSKSLNHKISFNDMNSLKHQEEQTLQYEQDQSEKWKERDKKNGHG